MMHAGYTHLSPIDGCIALMAMDLIVPAVGSVRPLSLKIALIVTALRSKDAWYGQLQTCLQHATDSTSNLSMVYVSILLRDRLDNTF
eukprot:m.166070 g.166070  ORF g.166070 m.166070 type:complete len:87 (+) comp16610_c0_seq3:136-396(+)